MTNAMQMYLDPGSIKTSMLKDLQTRLTNGIPIVDANNVPMVFLEMFSTYIANGMISVKSEIDALYKLRASTVEDLYRHMSDYDYIGLYATPASFRIVLELEKSYLVYNSKSYSDIYNRVIVPKNTVFTFGEYEFGIHYPINININKRTAAVIVEWDLSEDNPLSSITDSSIEFADIKEDGIELIQIHIPVFQFKRLISIETTTPDTGFVKLYSFTDRFYALRAFHYINNSDWEEIPVSLSETIYDTTNPSVRIVVNQDVMTLKIIIPSIYFSTNIISSQLKFELYTTKGEIDIETSTIDASTVTHNFNITDKDYYSTVLDKSTGGVIVYAGLTSITGGTNGITFSELKKRVVNNTFYGDVITTIGDIEKHFANLGFKASRYSCNLTDLIYLCHKQLMDSQQQIISAGNIRTYFKSNIISQYSDTVYVNSDDSLTILPSVVYKYDVDRHMCIPLTNTERSTLLALNKINKVNAFNTNYYTRSPFHVRVDRSARYPMAYSYDLNNPSAKYLKTVSENYNSDFVVKAYGVSLLHDGINGYDIKFLLSYSTGLNTDDIVVFFYTYNINRLKIWTQATYYTDADDKWVYNVHIDTNYMLFKNNSIFLETLRSDSNNTGFEVPLNIDAYIVIMVKSELLTADALSTTVGVNVGNNFPEYTPILEQSVNITFGQYISVMYNNVDVTYQEAKYLTYSQDVFSLADRDIFREDENGNLEYIIDADNSISYIKEYSAGDILKNADGSNKIKYPAGSTICDMYGEPIIDPNYTRNIDYVIDMIHVDGKLDLVTDTKYTNIMDYTRSILLSYAATIDEAYKHLLNGTKLFFTPIRTIGMTNSIVGNNVSLTHSLELEAHFKLYVQEYVYKNDAIRNSIRASIISLIDTYTNDASNNVIATDDIVQLIKTNISEYIINVDVFGFFNDPNIQTLICASSEEKPHLKQYLVIREDGVITVERSLTLDFVTA